VELINGKALHQAHDLLIGQLSNFVFIVFGQASFLFSKRLQSSQKP
jgi:hypothetical protein